MSVCVFSFSGNTHSVSQSHEQRDSNIVSIDVMKNIYSLLIIINDVWPAVVAVAFECIVYCGYSRISQLSSIQSNLNRCRDNIHMYTPVSESELFSPRY